MMRDVLAGDRFAQRYEVVRRAGRGGMGEVFEATDLETGERVALKLLHTRHPEAERRFRREAQILRMLDHPGIVRVIDAAVTTGPAGEQQFVVMEWLEGEDLASRLSRGPLEVSEVVALGAACAEALAFAHDAGIVHRDLKPPNVFLLGGDPGRARIVDFGVARFDGASVETTAGTLLGTAGYMAPEQVRGDAVGPPADVFALGAVLYECLVGRPAFSAECAIALLAKALLHAPPLPGAFRADVPASLDALLGSMLAKDAAARPDSMRAVVEALRSLEGLAPHAPGVLSSHSAERRLLAVVLARAGGVDATGATAAWGAGDGTLATTIALPMAGLRVVADRFGSRLDPIGPASAALTFFGDAAATDLAARAARAGLAVLAVAPEATMGLAIALGDASSPDGLGGALERAGRLVDAKRGPGLFVGEPDAPLLHGFELSAAEGLKQIRAERPEPAAGRAVEDRSPHLGRDRELSILLGLYDDCVDERSARAALVTAPAGLGKSRLGREVQRRVADHREPPRVWTGRADPIGAGAPFGLLADLLADAAGVSRAASGAERIARLERLVRSLVAPASAPRVLSFLGELLGGAVGLADGADLAAARGDQLLFGRQVTRAWVELVEGALETGPLLLVLEDLHWGDAPSADLVDHVLRACASRPLLVLGLARPELEGGTAPSWSERGALRIQLRELSPRASGALVRALLPGADEQERDRLVATSGGHPFYLEELARAHASGGGAPPQSMVAMIHARFEQLEAPARALLRASSVFGESFPASGVAALLGSASVTGEVEGSLASLERAEWLVASRASGGAELSFRHALLRDVAYGTWVSADLERAHLRAAAWLEALGDRDPAVIAEHFVRGGDRQAAVRSLAAAARNALRGRDQATTLRLCERALAELPQPPLRGELLLLAAQAHGIRGSSSEAADRAFEAMGVSPSGTRGWLQALRVLAYYAGWPAEDARVVGALSVLLDATREPEDVGVAAGALGEVARYLAFSGDLEAGERVSARLADLRRKAPADDQVEAWYRRAESILAGTRGDFVTSRAHAQEGASAFEALGDFTLAVACRINAADDLRELGQWEEARAEARHAVDLARRHGLERQQAFAAVLCAELEGKLGDPAVALAAADAATASIVTKGSQGTRFEFYSRRTVAQLALLAGEPERALAAARAALEVVRAVPPLRASAHATLATVWLAVGRPEEALEESTRGVSTLGEALGGVDAEGAVRLAHIEALLAARRRGEASAAAAVARSRLLARAAALSDAATRAAFLQRVPEHARTLALAAELGVEPSS